jgi:lipoyl(octanoyl) transferase
VGLKVVKLGRMAYGPAYRAQVDHVEEVLAARQAGVPEVGRLLLVEHPPVITVTKRASAAGHLIATAEALAREGVAVEETDRGGDITYHGLGQLVAYPILDLNLLNLGLHDYMRMLESVVIETCEVFGVRGRREAGATGVWVDREGETGFRSAAKIAAMGVRVRRWISMHGLAINVSTNLAHFDLIVPCGLAGRPVTSLERELVARGTSCPSLGEVQEVLVEILSSHAAEALTAAEDARRSAATSAHRV